MSSLQIIQQEKAESIIFLPRFPNVLFCLSLLSLLSLSISLETVLQERNGCGSCCDGSCGADGRSAYRHSSRSRKAFAFASTLLLFSSSFVFRLSLFLFYLFLSLTRAFSVQPLSLSLSLSLTLCVLALSIQPLVVSLSHFRFPFLIFLSCLSWSVFTDL